MPDRSLYFCPIANDPTALPSLKPPQLPCLLIRLVKIKGTKKTVDSPGEASGAQRNAIKAEAGILYIPDVTLTSAAAAPECTAASGGLIAYLCACVRVRARVRSESDGWAQSKVKWIMGAH